jgi:hypothetical protein
MCCCDDDDVRQTLFFPPLPILASRVKRQTAQSEKEEDDGGRVRVFTLSLSLVSCASRVCDDASSRHNTQKRSNNTHTLVRKQTAVLFFSFFY